MDVLRHNAAAWDHQVEKGNEWTIPVTSEDIARARAGDWEIVLTATRPVPRDWFPVLDGADVLCLASAGGQQAPVLAAAGARVTSMDLSPRQLARDREVADRDGLDLVTLRGDMRDLSDLDSNRFDLVFNPCSICFVPDVGPVWREAARVLAPGGTLLTGFINPVAFVFDEAKARDGELRLRHALPYSDVRSLTEAELQALIDEGEPLVWSHSLETLLAGQLRAGLVLADLYEDTWPDQPWSRFLPSMMATRALKPAAAKR